MNEQIIFKIYSTLNDSMIIRGLTEEFKYRELVNVNICIINKRTTVKKIFRKSELQYKLKGKKDKIIIIDNSNKIIVENDFNNDKILYFVCLSDFSKWFNELNI